jgi:hypothetical protein
MLVLVLLVVLGLAALSLTTPDSETRRTLAGATPSTTPSLATRTAVAARTALPRSRQAVIANTEGQGASLRREPSAQSERVTGLPEETVVRIVGPEVLDDGSAWVEVQDPDGNRGWIQSDLIRALEDVTPAESSAPTPEVAVPSPTPAPPPTEAPSQPAAPDDPAPTPG